MVSLGSLFLLVLSVLGLLILYILEKPRCFVEDFLRGVVGFSRFGLNHDGCVAVLVVLRTGGDGAYCVAGTESERRAQCSQCRDQYRDDGFDDLVSGHSF